VTNTLENAIIKVTSSKNPGCVVNFEVTALPLCIQKARKEEERLLQNLPRNLGF
jgi:hypothetical protein